MSPRTDPDADPEPRIRSALSFRPSGLVVITLVVLAGLGAGAGMYRIKQPEAEALLQRELAAAPKTPEGRLQLWLEVGALNVHTRLQTARISFQQPWLVTHAVGDRLGGPDHDDPPEVWGIDLTEVDKSCTRTEGLTVVVELPSPRMLHRTILIGENAKGVPHYEVGAAPPDPDEVLVAKVEWLLSRIAKALRKDVEGATLEVRVAGAAPAEPGGAPPVDVPER